MENTYQKTSIFIAAAASIIAGVLHSTVVAFEHVAAIPLETAFFIAGGVAQIVFAVLFYRSRSMKYAIATFSVNGGLAALWVLVRIFRAPFMSSPEGVGTMGLLVTGLQLLSMAAIGAWKWLQKHKIKKVHGYSYSFIIIGAVMLSLALGTSAYGAGRIGEIIMPERKIEHNHGHGGGHGHQAEKHDDTGSKTDQKHTSKEKDSKEKRSGEKSGDKTETSSKKKKHGHGHGGHH
jgi:hypothetical protein